MTAMQRPGPGSPCLRRPGRRGPELLALLDKFQPLRSDDAAGARLHRARVAMPLLQAGGEPLQGRLPAFEAHEQQLLRQPLGTRRKFFLQRLHRDNGIDPAPLAASLLVVVRPGQEALGISAAGRAALRLAGRCPSRATCATPVRPGSAAGPRVPGRR